MRFLASLSRVDGLIWLDSHLRLKAFGVEITVRDEPGQVFLAQNSRATKTKKLNLNQYGTRHRSMLRYCAANPKLSVQESTIGVPFPDGVPASLLPLKDNEFVVPLLGGTLEVDGVTISENSVNHTPLRTPPGSKRQLMFIDFISKGYGLLTYDERGLFWMGDDGQTLHAMNPSSRLSSDVRTPSGNALDSLRKVSKQLVSSQGATHDQ